MLNLAAQIIAGIAVTLERARIPLEIIGYSAYGESSSCTLRTNPAVFNLIKAFEEPRICLSRLVPHHGSNNSDPDALRLAGERLLSRREPKKVLLFMSDGEPYNGKVTAAARLAFKNELVLLGRHGVTVFGFGMGADLTQYFTNPNQHVSVSIGALRDLPRIMLKKLESILL
jgi:cobalamin biosynthesis protein CobT